MRRYADLAFELRNNPELKYFTFLFMSAPPTTSRIAEYWDGHRFVDSKGVEKSDYPRFNRDNALDEYTRAIKASEEKFKDLHGTLYVDSYRV
ncbi:MAG: hypothetical protein ABW007_03045 [Chitinophagaceae bacterium]